MPLDGNGQWVPVGSSVNPAVTVTTISSTDWNALLADLKTALGTAVYKDGQATPTANIGMGGFKLTNLAAATLVSDAVRASQVQNASFTSLTGVAGTNTITATATPTPSAYVVGQVFEGIAAATNTGATTLNISSLGAGAVQVAGAALTGGEIIINGPFRVFVSAVTPVFQLIANGQAAPFLDTNPLVKGSADGTKKIRFEVDGLTTATTRVYTPPDYNMQMGDGQIIAVGRNIAARTNSGTPNTKIDITADEICVRDANGTAKLLSTVSNTIDFGTVGANGLDASTQASSTWYYGYVIWNPATNTTALLGSTSSSAPTMPSGYTFKALVTAARSDGSTHFIKYRQFGNRVFYEGTNNVLNSGGVGSTETTVSLSSFVPPIALECGMSVYGFAAATGGGGISSQALVRYISNSTGHVQLGISQTANNTSAFGSQVFVPNVSQQVFALFSNTTNFNTTSFAIDVTAFKLPLGGE